MTQSKETNKGKTSHSNQCRFGCTRSLIYYLVVMLGARIDVIQPQIRNVILYNITCFRFDGNSTCFDMFPCCCSAMAWTRCCLGVGQKDGGRCSGWWLSSSDVTFLRKSQGLVKRHSYFMRAVCTLLWTDCFETYMVVTYPLDLSYHQKSQAISILAI